MKSNRITWGLVLLVVLITITISLSPIVSQSQQGNSTKTQGTKGPGSMEKYPVADYDAPEPSNTAERDERRQKSRRYDKKSFVMPKPKPEFTMLSMFDAETQPSALPVDESKLVIIGEILNAKGIMSTDRSAVYSEYSVQVERVLKQEPTKQVHTGQILTVDRTGGRVRYPNGQTVLYLNSWQDLPESTGRYVIFLDREEGGSPSFKIVTAYRLKDDKVFALDGPKKFHEFDGKDEGDFIKLVVGFKY